MFLDFDLMSFSSITTSFSGSKKQFIVKAEQSTSVEWQLEIPFGIQAVKYKIVAQAGNFTDTVQETVVRPEPFASADNHLRNLGSCECQPLPLLRMNCDT